MDQSQSSKYPFGGAFHSGPDGNLAFREVLIPNITSTLPPTAIVILLSDPVFWVGSMGSQRLLYELEQLSVSEAWSFINELIENPIVLLGESDPRLEEWQTFSLSRTDFNFRSAIVRTVQIAAELIDQQVPKQEWHRALIFEYLHPAVVALFSLDETKLEPILRDVLTATPNWSLFHETMKDTSTSSNFQKLLLEAFLITFSCEIFEVYKSTHTTCPAALHILADAHRPLYGRASGILDGLFDLISDYLKDIPTSDYTEFKTRIDDLAFSMLGRRT